MGRLCPESKRRLGLRTALTPEDMAMVVPPVKVTGGGEFTVELTIVTFNGKDGTPTFPKLDGDDAFDSAERTVLVDHAKLVLKQIWTTDPIHHHLRARRWTHLPSHVHKLTAQQAGLF